MIMDITMIIILLKLLTTSPKDFSTCIFFIQQALFSEVKGRKANRIESKDQTRNYKVVCYDLDI